MTDFCKKQVSLLSFLSLRLVSGFILGGLLGLAQLPSNAQEDWQYFKDEHFRVETASQADAAYVPQLFPILQKAARDLKQVWHLSLPESVTIQIHPDLVSFTETTGLPWYVSASADTSTHTIHTQRLRVLLERHSLEKTLRHELFHLAQPADWPRWRAEGSAMLFAGETPEAQPFQALSDEALDHLLAAAPDRDTLARAVATAFERVRLMQR